MDKNRRKNTQRVVCAMSGGVDSSVAAALLKRAGFNVIGVFMKFWSEPRSGSTRINADSNADLRRYENRCCTPEAEVRARKVAKILKIPFFVFNFEREFKKRIVDYFLKEYKKGLTPNPCVICNKEIKFGLLLEKALKLGADYVATGHYALKCEIKNEQVPRKREQKSKIKNYQLLRAKDKNKDQSYFLWQLNQGQLKRILFPIGDYTRKEVEKLAKKFKLPVLGIKKSVEICFIQTTVNDFLKRYFKPNPGKIVCLTSDVKQEVVGEHQGLWFFTIGQRKGIGLSGGPAFAAYSAEAAASAAKSGKASASAHRTSADKSAGKPYYVLDKDLKKNLLIVTRNEKDLNKKELLVKNVNWISGKSPKLPLKVKAKIRYRHQLASATLTYHLKPNTYHLIFDRPQRAITPGQSVVFYLPAIASAKAGKREELLGGGIIS